MAYVANKSRKELTAHNLAFGIGRKASKVELEELLVKPSGKGKSAAKVLSDLKAHLSERRNSRQASYLIFKKS